MSGAGGRSPGAGGAGAATLALTALTVATAVGMGRLFAGSAHLLPFAAAALAAHGAMAAGRRLGVPVAVGAAGAFGVVALAAAWLVVPEATVLGVPGPRTLSAAGAALARAWADFATVVAPAPVTDGFVLAGMLGIATTAVLADWAAFRMGVLFEAVVPSFTLFVFTAALGADRGRAPMVALYLSAVLLFLVVHRAGLEARGAAWFASRSRGGTAALVRGGAGLAVAAVVGALAAGPQLPGAAAEAVLDVGDGGAGGGRRTTVSPLVDIRGRLVDQSATEVFTVRSPVRAYWRLTSLDTFDGAIWSSDARYRRAGERLGARPAVGIGQRTEQEFTISSLSSIWLPAAYRPVRVEGLDDVSWNPDLGSLVTGEDTSDGLRYRVESVVPRLTPDDLGGDRSLLAGPELERFLRIPGVSRPVRALASRIVAGSDGTPYGRALALQEYLRAEPFTYDLGARPGHDGNALERFLFVTRRGYCEQFAGAYAVLARAVGLPTRVAVGFTPGELEADGLLHVRGLNAHAWPEVFIAGAGWVAFEPTPGRGAPGAEAYTGLPEAQARPEQPSSATTAAPTTVPSPDGERPGPSTTLAPEPGPGAGAGGPDRRRSPLAPLLLAVLAPAALAAAVPAAKGVRRRRRRAAAATAAARVLVAWQEAAEAVARAGAARRPAETLDEHARRAAGEAALPAPAASSLAALAGRAAAASYAPGALAATVVAAAVTDAATVERSVDEAATRRRRLAWALDPRPLLR